ncbi:DNA-binding transcriptional regulator DsdC [Craterilacuibacter sinensis]|uniref:DNA-binding transcriptional regulator DsdC n=1 Tax=Craterilacuibacter sinensis TaxID=2686017 RepID=A0A845BSK3_9NEIS|nr:DNA-binding transcriptional regulator DsdC [Craterilacuibacter sinensis]MXR38194.1 DNA-binding transcriptional regulator DsdC [Craterilacuibacter sinensis]RQW23862.1 DNA-binding transcriptional regulator DsdC [Rhodobacteraceae bacterium CH30]
MLNLSPRMGAKLTNAQFANLHTFLVAARHLSFARAAEELCLTASAVSHRIARLEQSLSLALFHRLTRRVALTEDGERIYRILQGAMGELSEALQQTPQAEVAGAIALYVRPSLAQCWLVPRLANFSARYPHISLDIRVGNDNVDFRTQAIDLALYYADGEFPGLVGSKLMGEMIAPVCSPEYAHQHGLLDTPDNLRHCTLLHDSLAWHNAAYDAEWRLWARHHQMDALLPERSLTFDRSDLCVIAALNHGGIAIGRHQLVQKRIDKGELILPFGNFTQPGHYDYYLVHPPYAAVPKRLQVLIDWLHECATQPCTPAITCHKNLTTQG